MPIIAPSLLAANFLRLQDECNMLNNSEADWFHLDVMDGRFVPNISFGPMLIQFFRQATSKVCDVHLMIEDPGNYAEQFKNAGADNLTVHYEACPHLHRNIQQIKSLGTKAVAVINILRIVSSICRWVIFISEFNPRYVESPEVRITELRFLSIVHFALALLLADSFQLCNCCPGVV